MSDSPGGREGGGDSDQGPEDLRSDSKKKAAGSQAGVLVGLCRAAARCCRAAGPQTGGRPATAAGPSKSGQGHTRAAKLAQTGPRLVALIKSQDLG